MSFDAVARREMRRPALQHDRRDSCCMVRWRRGGGWDCQSLTDPYPRGHHMHRTSLARQCAVALVCFLVSVTSAYGLQPSQPIQKTHSVQVVPAQPVQHAQPGRLSRSTYLAQSAKREQLGQLAHRATLGGERETLRAVGYSSTGSCGVERWSVKVGTDPDAGLVNTGSTTSQTITYLRGIAAPATIPLNARVQPPEITNFLLDATLVQYKLESDSDYHLVIKDSAGNTMIAEIPDPACVGASSPFASAIIKTRQLFDAKYTATTSFQTANIPVRLTGVAFFDFLHGQTGVAPNGMELHPLLNIVFNPGTPTADFGLSPSPSSVSINQGASTTTKITVVPTNGFSGNVSFTASGLPAGVTATFSPTSSTASTTLTLTASASATTGPATVSITGTSGTLSHATSVSLTVATAGGGTGNAVYNATLKAPGCSSVGATCDSGPSLLLGRGTLSGGTEPNHPNTINASCADGASGTFHSDESNDRLVISSTDGGPLTAGKTAKITATVWAYDPTTDALDLYSAANANAPSWTFLNTIIPAAAGAQTLTTTFTLPAGGLQAVRAHFRYQGTAAACSTGSYDDSDDLIFAVSSTAPAPDFSVSDAPSSVTVVQGTSGTSTVTVGSLNGFIAATSLSVSGLPAGVTATFAPTSVTPAAGGTATSTLTFNASSTATTGASTVTITATSGALSHTTTVLLSVTASGGGSSQLLGNTGFETGTAAPWVTTTGIVSNSTSEPPHAGSWDAWMNGYGSAHTDTVSQQVAIPSGKASATLSFYMHIDTAETSTTTAYDTLKVQVFNTSGTLLSTLYTYSNLNKNTGYSVHNLTMTPYIGQTVVVKFTGTEDASSQTSFVLDDATLTVQ
jgi:hypothetical protein